MNEWFDYLEETRRRFIERFADLDELEFPDKANEIKEARLMRLNDARWSALSDEIALEFNKSEIFRGEINED